MLLIYTFLTFSWFQDLVVYQSLKIVVGTFDKGVQSIDLPQTSSNSEI